MTTRSILHRARTLLGLPPRHEPKPPSQPHWRSLLGLERRPIRTVIDIGALDGDTAKFFHQRFPLATIHCFEPQPQQFQALQAWASTQGDRVVCHGCALGDQPGRATLHINAQEPGRSTLLSALSEAMPQAHPPTETEVGVAVARLDDVVSTWPPLVEEILVKIDTEGYDKQVIHGGMDTLRRAVGCIVEVHLSRRQAGQTTLGEMMQLMADANLHYAGNVHQSIRRTGTVGYVDAVFMRQEVLWQAPPSPA